MVMAAAAACHSAPAVQPASRAVAVRDSLDTAAVAAIMTRLG